MSAWVICISCVHVYFKRLTKWLQFGFFLLNTFYFLQKQFKMKKKIYLLKQNRYWDVTNETLCKILSDRYLYRYIVIASCNAGTLAFININNMSDGNFPWNHNNYHTAMLWLWEPFSSAILGRENLRNSKLLC